MDALPFDLKTSSLWLFLSLTWTSAFTLIFRHPEKAFTRITSEALNPQIEGKVIFLFHGLLKHTPFHQNHKITTTKKVKLPDGVQESMEHSTGMNGNRWPLLRLCHRAGSVLSVLHALIHLPVTTTL